MSARISVIMPVYNCERYLEKAIASVLAQEGAEVEIIAVEDCSKDGSRELLLRLAKDEPRIRAVCNETNMGVSAVRNRALALATGDYIAFCDSDDTVPAGAYASLLSVIGDKDIAIGSFENHIYVEDALTQKESCALLPEAYKSNFLALFSICCLWTKLIRTSFIRKHGLTFDESMSLGEDVVFLAHAATKEPTVALTEANVYHHHLYRQSDYRSLTHVYSLDAYRKHIECRQKLLEICRDIPECRDYVYLRFSGDVERYLHLLTDERERAEAFALFREYMKGYDYAEKPKLFLATVGIGYETFLTVSAHRFFEAVEAVPMRDRVAAEFDAGMIGLRYILRYFLSWLRFKLKRSYK